MHKAIDLDMTFWFAIFSVAIFAGQDFRHELQV